MNGKLKESIVVEEHNSNEPDNLKIRSIIDNCFRHCHSKYFLTLK